jgi:hypothetical protein
MSLTTSYDAERELYKALKLLTEKPTVNSLSLKRRMENAKDVMRQHEIREAYRADKQNFFDKVIVTFEALESIAADPHHELVENNIAVPSRATWIDMRDTARKALGVWTELTTELTQIRTEADQRRVE